MPIFNVLLDFAGTDFTAQQVCISVGEAFKGFKQLLKRSQGGELHFNPKPPNYRKSGGLYQISYPKRWLKLKDWLGRVFKLVVS